MSYWSHCHHPTKLWSWQKHQHRKCGKIYLTRFLELLHPPILCLISEPLIVDHLLWCPLTVISWLDLPLVIKAWKTCEIPVSIHQSKLSASPFKFISIMTKGSWLGMWYIIRYDSWTSQFCSSGFQFLDLQPTSD